MPTGKNAHNYKDGRTLRNYYCQDCGKEIRYRAKRCGSCANKITTKKKWQKPEYRKKMSKALKGNQNAKGYKQTEEHKNKNRLANSGKNHHNYIDGRSIEKHYCIDCGKELKNIDAERCPSCAGERRSGKNNPNYIDGRSLAEYFCVDCGKELSGYTIKRCNSCNNKERWQNGGFDGAFRSPTKPEKEIMKILEKLKIDYIFQFRPKNFSMVYDFYVTDMNLLIEFDGIYWHSLPKVKTRDVKKTQYAKENHYGLLRTSEHTLCGLENMILDLLKE